MAARHPEVDLLVAVTAAAAGQHQASELARSAIVHQEIRNARYVRRDLQWPASMPYTNAAWDAFFPDLRLRYTTRQHPLHAVERDTVSFFDLYMDSVLRILNDARQQLSQQLGQRHAQHFTSGNHLTIDLFRREPRIDVTGTCGYVIWSDRDVCCLVEHKRYAVDNQHFNEGVAQAILYAAAYRCHRRHRPVLAIVTDLYRWQFLVVDGTGCRQSRVHTVTYGGRRQNREPDPQPLRNVLGLVCGFLATEWHADW